MANNQTMRLRSKVANSKIGLDNSIKEKVILIYFNIIFNIKFRKTKITKYFHLL
jgi:hypothetical protein